MAKLMRVKVNLSLPYIGGVEGTWESDDCEQKAAWEMYVELATRNLIQAEIFCTGTGHLSQALRAKATYGLAI
jgi:hypothetical protein